ncbi:MAG: lipoyl(octanoyl) transferase LipB [Mariprofundales bacterium]|nr:lipoyl(octanoyl) transferase LipB [Mariprofundales bacterium]
MSNPDFRWLGRQPYQPFATAMRQHAEKLQAGDEKEVIWCCEHDPIYTTGRRAIDNRITPTLPAALIVSDRGGETTFHGPGQLMLYPIINLKRRHLAPRAYVALLEEGCIRLLADYGIITARRKGAPGVWTTCGKIAAIGLRISRGVVWHGMALNVTTKLAWFDPIHPCGLNFAMDSIAHHATPQPLAVLANQWAKNLNQLLEIL